MTHNGIFVTNENVSRMSQHLCANEPWWRMRHDDSFVTVLTHSWHVLIRNEYSIVTSAPTSLDGECVTNRCFTMENSSQMDEWEWRDCHEGMIHDGDFVTIDWVIPVLTRRRRWPRARQRWHTPRESTCCKTLQHTCNTLQHTATHCNIPVHHWHVGDGRGQGAWMSTLQHSATHLQHTATHCNTLQHTATHLHGQVGSDGRGQSAQISTLQHTATHLQHTATHLHGQVCGDGRGRDAQISRVQHSTTRRLHTATHCNTRQHTATHLYGQVSGDGRGRGAAPGYVRVYHHVGNHADMLCC